MIFGSITAHLAGLFFAGFLIKSMRTAKRLILFSIVYCLICSSIFFFKQTILWSIALVTSSFLAGLYISSWGFYFKNCTPVRERIKTAADGLIFSNLLMILINFVAIRLSPYAGLTLSMLFLGFALFFALRLQKKALYATPPEYSEIAGGITPEYSACYGGMRPVQSEIFGGKVGIHRPLLFLCLFIAIITINSGLMYQVINPAFAHHEWLVSWYWAVPYIAALFIMRNLPVKINRTYLLYFAIAMIGFSFIFFMVLDRSAWSYLVINTLMLGACGVYDLFWWSILGEMLDLDKNPAKILGTGLSANVLGVLLGGLIGSTIAPSGASGNTASILALAVVCISLAILPPLHKHLSSLLKNHAFLNELSGMSQTEQNDTVNTAVDYFAFSVQLTDRESEIAALLLKGRTYKMIACELYLSENTVKTHIKNIYSKFSIKSRMELVNLMLEKGQILRK